ncbi:TRAP transporter large permease [Parasedimentitalea psychrophila]|uniref:TRAP transporter large permease subunit n=1 Tax=Parasedimentitalea psychrophila TaxID=2997337 RepID=A0A9Y2L3M8_9RHOB|nr:TRAP transporter large permease subunit [Parasedimentitalea psychrophila]WIY27081.1 TRAP transporter large permease subunit [Parasedimentitalea psychrophila]
MEILSAMGMLMDLNQWLVLVMFLTFIFMLFRGIPVVYSLVGVSLIFSLIAFLVLDPNKALINEYIAFHRTGVSYVKLHVNAGRFFGSIIKNPILVALPMFIYMGLMLDQSGVAQKMMRSMQVLFGALKGGLALTVMLIGIILAASTGVIGASVVLLGVMGIPTMMDQGYAKPIATGTIAASGTLGILIPPSIMLVIMSDQLAISLGDLFMGALFPGLLLGVLYIVYIIVYGLISPSSMPVPENREPISMKVVKDVALSVVPPFGLIIVVLGSIFFGLATPTEASGLGALGATLLALASRNLNGKVFLDVMRQTLNTSGYIVGIFIAANFFSYILRRFGGDEIIENMVLGSFDNPYLVIAFILFIIFLLGFLLDWIEITLIIMPLMLPVIVGLNIPVEGYGVVDNPSVVWFAILVAVTLQTSFLTPPVGFALFYLKGVCPPNISLSHIYRGIIPFVLLQILGLLIVFFVPQLTTWLPAVAYAN